MFRHFSLAVIVLCLVACSSISAQQFAFPANAISDNAALEKAMPSLAHQVLAVYKDADRDSYLNNLFRLQLAAGQYSDAAATVRSLRDLRLAADSSRAAIRLLPFQLYAQAKDNHDIPFDQGFQKSFRDFFGPLDNLAANQALSGFGPDLKDLHDDLQKALDAQKSRNDISLPDALSLVRKYETYVVFQNIQSLAETLTAEDDARRYIIDDTILVKTPDGAHIATMVVRPRSATGPLPTLLGFTIYANPTWSMTEARTTAAHGYAAAVAYTRGKGRSPDTPIVPYEHDGTDGAAVVEWLSKQPWSDGRVGMYGGSYNGFAQWAIAKHMPSALKAMMTPVAVAPGIDVPMEGNVFMNFLYPWPIYTTTNKTLDDADYSDIARWQRLNRTWYTTGLSYRSLEKIDGTPNPIFQRWLHHPSYDSYWQNMIPQGDEYAKINIPILATDGYLEGQGLSCPYYFTQHYKYNPRAEHYYLVGPYNHLGVQRHPDEVLDGYRIDPVARINTEELRYQWFDYVFKGGKKPELLQDKVNYEVMGANEWKHAPSLDAMSNASLRFYLVASHSGDKYQLARQKPSNDGFVPLTVNFADRSDVDKPFSSPVLDKFLDTRNGVVFISEPFQQPTEISGLFSGRLDFITNKKDVDINIALVELMPDGQYFQLSNYLARASYIEDRSHRQLLTPGKRTSIAFKCGRVTSRKFQPGSRLIVVLSVMKQRDTQINYGTGKDVSDESIADAKKTLQIKWFTDSYLDIPIWK